MRHFDSDIFPIGKKNYKIVSMGLANNLLFSNDHSVPMPGFTTPFNVILNTNLHK